MCTSNCLLVLIAILFPPLPVWVKRGLCSPDSLINILLLLLGYVPGLIHAWYIIFATPDHYWEYERIDGNRDVERAPLADARQPGPRTTVTHYYVVGQGTSQQQQQQQGYGATTNVSQAQGGQAQGNEAAAEVPPTYSDAVKGDNKVQRT